MYWLSDNINIETIICSSEYEKYLGGQEKLLAFARENKIKKITNNKWTVFVFLY